MNFDVSTTLGQFHRRLYHTDECGIVENTNFRIIEFPPQVCISASVCV